MSSNSSLKSGRGEAPRLSSASDRMTTTAKLSCVVLFAAALLPRAALSGSDEVAVRRELQLIYIFENEKPVFLFVIGQSGFKSVESLKAHLETWPPGSELKWAPGCVQFGDEPLLSSEKDMEAFRAFLEARKIRFVLVPSG